jgi:4-amino-4-deoxy-L-arabinose transferase-like glycosyltransferase
MTLAALLGLSIGTMALVGNAGLAIVPALLWQLYRQLDQSRQTAYQFAVVILCALLVVAPWLVRNEVMLGHPVLNTNFGFNLYIGNNANADGRYISMSDTPLGAPAFQEMLRSRGEYETYKYLGNLAKQYILENPGHTIALGMKKAVLFWEPPNVASSGGLGETLARWVNYSEHWLLLIGFVIFSIWSARRDRRYLFLTAAVVFYTAMHMPFYPFARYRVPIMPIVCLGAGFAADLLLCCWSRTINGRFSAPTT